MDIDGDAVDGGGVTSVDVVASGLVCVREG
jgi:hypothetical protein